MLRAHPSNPACPLPNCISQQDGDGVLRAGRVAARGEVTQEKQVSESISTVYTNVKRRMGEGGHWLSIDTWTWKDGWVVGSYVSVYTDVKRWCMFRDGRMSRRSVLSPPAHHHHHQKPMTLHPPTQILQITQSLCTRARRGAPALWGLLPLLLALLLLPPPQT